MERNFARALLLVLKHEGGWSDHPKDPGGATMKGVTLANYRRYVKPKATKADLRKITDAEISHVYKRFYWDAVSGDELPDGVDYAVFDFAVNSGPSRAIKYLQSVVGVVQDGVIGPKTLAATRKMMKPTVINDLCDKRMGFLKGLKTFPTFGKGWTRRVSDVRAEALKMAVAKREPEAVIVEREVEKPVVADPEELDKPLTKSKTFWQWIFTPLLSAFATFGGFDWRIQLVMIAVVVGFAVYAIKRRGDLARAVRDLKAELS